MLVALHCFAALADGVRRAVDDVGEGRLTAAVHATAGLKFTSVAFMVLAFYTLIWPDATFQRDSVARRVRRAVSHRIYMCHKALAGLHACALGLHAIVGAA